ncbi:hypothetical protein [Klebsiella aerogenes]|uniref:hypothetical protein n=1 Tax=Klebsiella aerogenes TaxID=548 RepID=UPI00044FE973|nr:hypothetical protein [Klebsiella aerogenes]EUL55890.1 hypothetical protein P848_02551 [Klebsiella aerogenes UCI 45]EUL75720.1 hypothetical protein P831_04296 [Klebsiella aerogenes UCI 28]EUL83256.1 hypothetical protein P830_02271 [Klebsiella aerogenes UCI 27]
MIKSTITRERLQEIAEDGFLKHGESKELARMALAAMDSEPVAWTDEEELRDANESGSGYLFGIERDANKFADPRRQIMLYRHAQPAPVVLDERAAFNAWNNEDNLPIAWVGSNNAAWLARASLCRNSVPDVPPERPADSSSGDDVEAWFDEDWNACRAAMLQAEPVTTANKLGNSPVIPDGWKLVPVEPNGDMLAAAQDAYGETDGDIASTLRAAIAAAPQEVKP